MEWCAKLVVAANTPMRLKLLLQRGEDATDRQDYVVLYLIDKKYTSRLVLLLKKHH